MIKLKDVIHFYVGCDIQGQTHKEVVKLTGIINQTVCVDGMNKNWADFSDVKPILKPISILYSFDFEAMGYDMTLFLEDYLKTLFGYKINGITDNFTINELIYLTKNGFDIFELIESGQAIDKTQLK